MILAKKTLSTLLGILLLTLTSSVLAEKQPQIEPKKYLTDDCHVIYYNAIPTGFLTPKVAETYRVMRSKRRGLLNISIRQYPSTPEGDCLEKQFMKSKAVMATVTAKAANKIQQPKTFKMRQIEEGDAIYYIDDFGFSHKENFDFTITVVIDGQDKVHEIEFSQQFFVD